MKRNRLLLIFIVLLSSVITAAAHPLGNFSVNQYTRIEIDKSQIHLRQVFDMAEIPTFQESSLIDTDKNGFLSDAELHVYLDKITPAYLQNLQLIVGGEQADLTVNGSKIWTEKGAGELPTLKINWDIIAKIPSASGVVHFENRNYADRVGWNEIVVAMLLPEELQ